MLAVLGILAGAAGLTSFAPAPAGADLKATAVAAGSVQALVAPTVTLAPPVDMRINGFGFTGSVLGAATGPALNGYAAPDGQRLWMFGLRWQVDNNTYNVSATLITSGLRTALPLPPGAATSSDTMPLYWVASVPANATDVAVELASGGFAQTFSLSQMAREGPQPVALYRDPSSWQASQDLNLSKAIGTPHPELPDATLPVNLQSLTVSYFGPGGSTNTAASVDRAWLTLNLTSQTENGRDPTCACWLNYKTTAPASGLTLTIPGAGAPIPSMFRSGAGGDQNS